MERVAVFVDWDNLRSTIGHIQSSTGFRHFNYNDTFHLHTLFRSFLEGDEKFYRIYIYTAKMLSIDEISSLIKERQRSTFERWLSDNRDRYENKYRASNKFLDEIVTQDYVALRLGKLRFNGLRTGGYPDIVQKEVDMLLGLDISHISYLHLADKVMLFSKDTDIIPAMKTARINGLEVILPILQENDNISDKLIKHSDIRRYRSLKEIYETYIGPVGTDISATQ